jgi:protein-S-isoprenylcysteine O-methyltransferase Ste14
MEIGKILFKYRSYTPLPFIFLMVLFMEPTLKTMITGLVLVLAGEAIRIWAVSYAGSETRVTGEVGASTLVTQGPYSIIRNPLYLGNVLIYAGFGVMSNSLFPYLLFVAICFFIFQYYYIIKTEEEFLRNTYKDKFEKYCAHVNRILPLPKELPPEIISFIRMDLKSGLRSDRRTLQAIIIISLLILFGFFFPILRVYYSLSN